MIKIKLAAVLSCLLLCGASRAQKTQSTEDDIIRLVERYDSAWTHKDAAGIERVLAADFVYFSSKGVVQSRQQVLAMALSPKYTLASAERSEIKVYRMSSTVVVGSRWKGHGVYDGKEFHDDQRCSIVLGRENQSWQILAEHCTQIASE